MKLHGIDIDFLPTRDSYVRTVSQEGMITRTIYHEMVKSNVKLIIRWDLKFYLSQNFLDSNLFYYYAAAMPLPFIDRDGKSYSVFITRYLEQGSYIQGVDVSPYLSEVSMTIETAGTFNPPWN